MHFKAIFLLEWLGHQALTFHQLLIDLSVGRLCKRLVLRVKLVRSIRRRHHIAIADVCIGSSWLILITIFPNSSHFKSTFILLRIGNRRLVCLLLLILIDPLQDAIHLLLEE